MLKLLEPFLKRKPYSILGIDITSSAVKIIEISITGNKPCVEGYGRENLPPNTLEGNAIKDINAVSDCIKTICIRSQLTSKYAVLAVSDSSVISKIVQMNEGMTDDEIEELVLLEANKYIPYPIDEISLDFEVQGRNDKNTAMLDILIVASRTENVNSRVAAVTRAGLEAQVVEVESLAVERAVQQLIDELPFSAQDKIIAIVDLGANYTHLFVLQYGKIVFSREEKFGGMQLVDAIADYYQMTSTEALAAKNSGDLPPDFETQVLAPFNELVLLQIRRTLQFFYSTSQHGSVDYIFLAGGLSKEPGLATLIQQQLGIKITVANPLSQMDLSKKVDLNAINNDAPALLVACGLALRHVE